MRNRFLRALGIGLVAWLVGQPPLAGGFEPMELWAYDRLVAWGGRPHAQASMVLVEIDPASLQAFPEPLSLWSRYHAELVRGLRAAGATVVGFDLLPTASYDEIVEARVGGENPLGPERLPSGDQDLAFEARRGPVLFIEFVEAGGRVQRPFPLLALALGPSNLAAANLSPDADSVARRQALTLASQEGPLPTLPLAMALRHRGVRPEAVRVEPGRLFLGALEVRTLEGPASPTVLVDFRGPPGSFPSVPYAQALRWIRTGSPELERFRGRAVLVCSTDPGLHDFCPAAWAMARMPGGEVHANTFETLLAGAPLRPLEGPWAGALRGLLVLGVVGLAMGASPGFSLAGALLLALGHLALSGWAFARHDLWMPVVAPLASAGLALAGVYVYRYLSEFRERRRLRRVLARYVSDPVAREILENPERSGLGGTRRRISILLSDLDDFTTLSEDRPPEEIMATLNEYFTLMEGIIHSERGTLKQFVGDEIMVLFGAPVPREDHARAAARTAWRMDQALREWSKRRQEGGKVGFTAKIGLHTGDVVVGNVGSPNRTEYAAVGDVVNTTARIEGLNKKLGTALLMSREFLEEAGEAVRSRPAGFLAVKGRHAEVEVFELLGLEEAP